MLTAQLMGMSAAETAALGALHEDDCELAVGGFIEEHCGAILDWR
jgi:hypothetical protein